MAPGHSVPQLIERLADQLGPGSATALVDAIVASATKPDAPAGVWLLLEELTDAAPKAARGAIEALLELQRRGLLAEVLLWLDLGVAIAADSGALALRYFKESPLLLGLLDPPHRAVVLAAGLELADRQANVAVEFIRVAPEVVPVLPQAEWATWNWPASCQRPILPWRWSISVRFPRSLACSPSIPFEPGCSSG